MKAAWLISAGMLEKMESEAYGRLGTVRLAHVLAGSLFLTVSFVVLPWLQAHWTSRPTFIVGLPPCKLSLETPSLSPLGICLTSVLAVSQTNQVDNQK